jgi:hypothetical protein
MSADSDTVPAYSNRSASCWRFSSAARCWAAISSSARLFASTFTAQRAMTPIPLKWTPREIPPREITIERRPGGRLLNHDWLPDHRGLPLAFEFLLALLVGCPLACGDFV